ncbi:5523_t:CDS:2, partial [Gigaspora margarita]
MPNGNNEVVEVYDNINREITGLENFSGEELITKIQELEQEKERPERNGLVVENLELIATIESQKTELNKRKKIKSQQQTIFDYQRKELEASFESIPTLPTITYPQREEGQTQPKETKTISTQTDKDFPNRVQGHFYRIFGRKECNQIRELRIQLQKTRTELLLAQNQVRNLGEKTSGVKPLPMISKPTETEEIERGSQPAPEYLNAIYPSVQRTEITELYISGANLTGELDLGTFENLVILDCSRNRLINIKNLNPKKIKHLYLNHNNFPGNLTLFSQLVNLERLEIRDNHFSGSLEPLVNLGKLNYLNIEKTNITSGLEYLPDNNKKEVILKTLYNSRNLTTDFLQEVACHKLTDGGANSQVVKCYGISQNPTNKDYIMRDIQFKKEDTKFYQEYKKVAGEYEKVLKTSKHEYKLHPSAVYTSRLLDFKNLPKPQNSSHNLSLNIENISYQLQET